MNTRFLQRVSSLLILLGLAVTSALGQAQQKPLDDKDNPLLIGKRDINKGQIDFYSLDKEIALGRQLSAEYDREAKFVTDPLIVEYVNRVGQNLVLHSDAKVPFTIKVVDDSVINAFALPGGHLYINRGIMEAADNEAEMAGVIAHEIAHVAARHGVEQASKGSLINYASLPLIFLGGVGGFAIQQAAGLAIPLTFLKFSRGAEEEADRLGAQYLWASGYDPQAMLSFFEKLEAKEKKKPGTMSKVFSTHPMTGDRIKAVNALVVRFPDKQEYEISSSDFTNVKARLISISPGKAADTQANRPTLKRRPAGKSGDDKSTDDTSAEQPPERPTLKRSGEQPKDPSKPEEPETPKPEKP
ncbi:MAG TPA: M48 family metallopeptidase [Blastocatellia bacterium]|nr:M48 family metallopeptidase [Blastocatellia bacterium]